MADFLTRSAGKAYLDSLTNLVVALYTAPPTESTAGTELTGGGYSRQPYSTPVAANGLAGETARRVGTNILFTNMPVASSAILGLALIDSLSGEIVAVDDTWTPSSSFAVGGNLLIDSLVFATLK